MSKYRYSVSGPWDDEPDEWIREMVAALRHDELGTWCGYVAVTKGHPLYEAGTRWTAENEEYELSVHGGVTYTNYNLPGREPYGDLWWIGFDCGHAWDVVPFLSAITGGYPGATYRDLEYVKAQIMSMMKQLYLMRRGVLIDV